MTTLLLSFGLIFCPITDARVTPTGLYFVRASDGKPDMVQCSELRVYSAPGLKRPSFTMGADRVPWLCVPSEWDIYPRENK